MVKKSDKINEQVLTYDDYAKLDNENQYELVEGTLQAMTPAPTPKHQLVAREMEGFLRETCGSSYITLLSPIDVILSKTEVRQPDIVVVHRNRAGIITERGIEGLPDLVVEVLLIGSIKRDRVGKLKTYSKYGIPEYWIVDIKNKVLEKYILINETYELKEVYSEDMSVKSENLSCVSFTLNEVWGNLPHLPNAEN